MHTTSRPDASALPPTPPSPSMLGANDGAHRSALALTVAARWCVEAVKVATGERPDLSLAYAALAAAVAFNTAAALDALAVEVTRWCELAACDPYDAAAMGPLMLAGCDASALCFHAARDLDGDVAVHASDDAAGGEVPERPPRR